MAKVKIPKALLKEPIWRRAVPWLIMAFLTGFALHAGVLK